VAVEDSNARRKQHGSTKLHLPQRLRRRAAGLHGHPPLTPAAVLLSFPFAVPVLLSAFVFLGIGAAVNGGELLLTWDEPVQRAVEGARTPWLDRVVRFISQLGGTTFVVVGLAVLLVVVWRRCRSLALVLLLATVARPLLEWTLKNLVDRPRPNFDRMVSGDGPSFPSGHPMAAVALWGLVPPLVALLTHRRTLWWLSVVISGVVIGLVSASRIYLGVHWLSDVVGALMLGSLYLLAVEWLLDWHHERQPCDAFVVKGHDLDEDLRSRRAERPPAELSSV
jgi:undecaprenyl-diphosphatase